MEERKHTRLYIVSFGDSRQYRLEIDTADTSGDSKLTEAERELNAYLRERFPGETFAYYTTPRIVEISDAHRDQYADYPILDEQAIATIREVLVKEVKDMRNTRQLNLDAPYANVNDGIV